MGNASYLNVGLTNNLLNRGTLSTTYSKAFYTRGNSTSYSFEPNYIELNSLGTDDQSISLVTDNLIDVTNYNKIAIECSVEGIVGNNTDYGSFFFGICESREVFSNFLEVESRHRALKHIPNTSGIIIVELDISNIVGSFYQDIALDTYVQGGYRNATAKIYSISLLGGRKRVRNLKHKGLIFTRDRTIKHRNIAGWERVNL